MEKTVIELFAGVGGFRVGLNNVRRENNLIIEDNTYKIVWFNQFEPTNRKNQFAHNCYIQNFNEHNCLYSNTDISKVPLDAIPKHSLLVGGFPCQDYSVARTLSNNGGIEGKKGVLWWEIYKILKNKKTPFFILENVDRLLKSPAKQRGRDFAIMLGSLSKLGYAVEWKVINAADYGHVQKRKRVFIFGYRNNTNHYKLLKDKPVNIDNLIFNKEFPYKDIIDSKSFDISIAKHKSLVELSEQYSDPFFDSGICINYQGITWKTTAPQNNLKALSSILQNNVDDEFYLNDEQLDRIFKLRLGGRIKRTSKSGFEYYYSQGSIGYYDSKDKPGRTMLTSEGTINRSSHLIFDKKKNRYRFLTPIEAELLNEFPINWTKTDMSKRQRYFTMGNALVTGIIKRLSPIIGQIIDNED